MTPLLNKFRLDYRLTTISVLVVATLSLLIFDVVRADISAPTAGRHKIGETLHFNFTWEDPNLGDSQKIHVCMLNTDGIMAGVTDFYVDTSHPGGGCYPEMVGSDKLTTANPIVFDHELGEEDARLIGCNLETGEYCTFTALFIICDQTGACSLLKEIKTTDDTGTKTEAQHTYGAIQYIIATNELPVPQDISVTVQEDSTNNSITLSATDPDAEDANSLTYRLGSPPAHGTVGSDEGDRFLSYTPAPDFYGTDTFTYTVNDTHHTEGATGTVTVTVTPVNDAPRLLSACVNKAGGPCSLGNKPSVDVGAPLTFEVHWAEVEQEAVTVYICKTNNISGTPFNCDSGQTITSQATPQPSPAADNSLTLSATASLTDTGKDVSYFVYVCDASLCSSNQNNQGIYHVNQVHRLHVAIDTAETYAATGTVTSSPAGINCGSDCEEFYPDTYTVTLTAAPGSNAIFDRWDGCTTVTGNACAVSMSAAREVVAYFKQTFNLTLTSTTGGKVNGPNGACPPTCTQALRAGTPISVSTTADANYAFNNWSNGTGVLAICNTGGASTAATCPGSTIPLTADSAIKANFVPATTFTLNRVTLTHAGYLTGPADVTITYIDIGGATQTKTCLGSSNWTTCVATNVKSGQPLDITTRPIDLDPATTAPDMAVAWGTGCDTSVPSTSTTTDATCHVNSVPASSASAQIEYYAPPITLTINKNPTAGSIAVIASGAEHGNLTCTPTCTPALRPGELLSLDANPDGASGYSFDKWTATSGGLTSINNNTSITLSGVKILNNSTVTANYFQAVTFTVNKVAHASYDLQSAPLAITYTRPDGTAGTTPASCATVGWTTCSFGVRNGTAVNVKSTASSNMNIAWPAPSGCSGTPTSAAPGQVANCDVASATAGAATVRIQYYYTPLTLTALRSPATGGSMTGGSTTTPAPGLDTCLFNGSCSIKPGDTVTVTAVPDGANGYSFDHWIATKLDGTAGGGLSSCNNSTSTTCSSVMNSDAKLTAVFIKAVTLTINKTNYTCTPSTPDCNLPSKALTVNYVDAYGVAKTKVCDDASDWTTCTVSAVDGSGSNNVSISTTAENNMRIDWPAGSGCSTSSNANNPPTANASCTVNGLSANKTINVQYYYTGYTLTIAKNPSAGGAVSGTINGVASSCIGTGSCSNVRAGAVIALTQTASAGYVVSSWTLPSGAAATSGCTAGSSGCTFTMPANNGTLTVNYNVNLTLTKNNVVGGSPTISVPASGSVAAFTCGSVARPFPCTQAYPVGTSLTITASPSTGPNKFHSWVQDCSGSSTTCSVSLTIPKTAKARFTDFITQTDDSSGLTGFDYGDRVFNNTAVVGSGSGASITMSGIGSWSTTQLDSGTSDYPSLTIGANNFARVTHHNLSGLQFINCGNTACTSLVTNQIDGPNVIGRWAQVSLDSSGLPMVSSQGDGYKLKFLRCADVNCATNSKTVVDGGPVGQYTNHVLASDGFASIVYYDFGSQASPTQNLLFTHCLNADCTSSTTPVTLDSTGDVGTYNSIVLGADGFARVSYYRADTGDLKFVRCTNAACSSSVVRTVTSSGNVGRYSSIAMGGNGFPVIAYQDVANNNLMVARCLDADCASSTISQADNNSYASGYNISMALGSDGFPRIAHTTTSAGVTRLEFVRCLDATCTAKSSGIIGPASASAYGTELKLNSSGNGMIAYINSSERISLAYQTSLLSGTYRSGFIPTEGDSVFFQQATVSWTATLNGQTLVVEAKSDYDPNNDTGWQIMTNGGTISNFDHIRYRATFSTDNISVSPTLDSVTITFIPE